MDGCFDIMHSGHYNCIRQCKAICDVLVVGVHSDQEISENKAIPVMTEPERYAFQDCVMTSGRMLGDWVFVVLFLAFGRRLRQALQTCRRCGAT